MVEAGFYPEKKYSQNFLIDDNVVHALVAQAHLSPGDRVLEIGTGTGTVTHAIAETGAFVVSVEIRPELVEYSQKKLAGKKNVTFIEGDILGVQLEKVSFTKVVCSPPYAIADDIMY